MIKKQTIRILLINSNNELLLMRVVDPTTTRLDLQPRAAFWCTVGGKIEPGESIEQAARRELFEETGYSVTDVTLGPIVWYGLHEMIISGKHMELDEKFIVMHVHSNAAPNSDNFTENEKSVVTHLEWLSMDQIRNSKEPIYPAVIQKYLPEILAKQYPTEPLWIDLALQPD